MENITREELISICEDAVVHHTKWHNRDSYSAQLNIRDVYKGLTAGLDFKIITKEDDPFYHSSESTLIISFPQPIDFNKLKEGRYLSISSREDYWRDCDPNMESEMFDGEGIDFYSNFTQTYIPSRSRLDYVKGDDWY